MNRDALRTAALEIFRHALITVDTRLAARNAVNLDGSFLRVAKTRFEITNQPVYLVGIGKAALAMAHGLNDVLGGRVSAAVVSSTAPTTSAPLPSRYQFFNGGHPLPNEQSLEAAKATFELLDRANRELGIVIFLVSGGGSAMLEWPVSNEISLDDLREANRQLVTSGASIAEINAIRRSFSAVKGGALARRAPNARIVTLIVSDTNRGDEASVASGPTLPVPAGAPDSVVVVEKYGLISTLPPSVLTAIRRQPTANRSPQLSAPCYVLLDSSVAMEAARQRAVDLGFTTTVENDIVEQSIEEGTELLLERIANRFDAPSCSISSGEFGCRVEGNGRGGRNLETVLRCALRLDQESTYHTVVLSAGTDGIDGSSYAAGAIADEGTIRCGRALGLDADDYLRRSDSHAFFEALADLVVTGPTGTNVRDLRLLLRA
ncbi:MAG TPA: DUF4147 domain-containing protein [Pyrinomonadaceae bacterium]